MEQGEVKYERGEWEGKEGYGEGKGRRGMV